MKLGQHLMTGLPTVQFLTACSMQKQGEFLHTASNQNVDGGKVWEQG